jgi:hypothetical protein
MCMMMRGVEKQNSLMKTSAMLGSFRAIRKPATNSVLLQLRLNALKSPRSRTPPGNQSYASS